MIKLVGFNAAHGTFISDKTGEPVNWSNRVLRCITDIDLQDNDFGFAVFEKKLSKSHVCKSLGLDVDSSEDTVNNSLRKILNSNIEFTNGRVGTEIEVNGFKVINAFPEK